MIKLNKNLFFIHYALLILGLILKRMAYPGGSIVLIAGAAGLAIYYLLVAQQVFSDGSYQKRFRNMIISAAIFIGLSLVGVLFRHQWWPMPLWDIIFQVLWPIALLILVIDVSRNWGKYIQATDRKTQMYLNQIVLLPLMFVALLGAATFFTPSEVFCTIFKPYSFAEIQQLWESTHL